MNKIKYLAFSLLLITSIFSQGLQEVKLLKVNVEGNEITSASVIRYTSGLSEGQTISGSDFPRAVKRLWQLGVFSDVQINLDEETLDGVSLTIKVEENYILGNIHFEGNKKTAKYR